MSDTCEKKCVKFIYNNGYLIINPTIKYLCIIYSVAQNVICGVAQNIIDYDIIILTAHYKLFSQQQTVRYIYLLKVV